jgi:hypothetical protein
MGALLVAGVAGAEMLETPLLTEGGEQVGIVTVWHTATDLHALVTPFPDAVLLSEVHIWIGLDPVPISPSGNPQPQRFNSTVKFITPSNFWPLEVPLSVLGIPAGEDADLYMAIHCVVVPLDPPPRVLDAWADGPYVFDGTVWGTWFVFPVDQPD